MTCIKCGEPRAHRSHRAGWKDRAYRLFQYIPYRCRGCGSRFYAYRAGERSDHMRTREEQKIMQFRRRIKWKKSRREFVVLGVGVAMLAFLIYYVIQQRVVSE